MCFFGNFSILLDFFFDCEYSSFTPTFSPETKIYLSLLHLHKIASAFASAFFGQQIAYFMQMKDLPRGGKVFSDASPAEKGISRDGILLGEYTCRLHFFASCC